jgi:hypothetical protein
MHSPPPELTPGAHAVQLPGPVGAPVRSRLFCRWLRDCVVVIPALTICGLIPPCAEGNGVHPGGQG